MILKLRRCDQFMAPRNDSSQNRAFAFITTSRAGVSGLCSVVGVEWRSPPLGVRLIACVACTSWLGRSGPRHDCLSGKFYRTGTRVPALSLNSSIGRRDGWR